MTVKKNDKKFLPLQQFSDHYLLNCRIFLDLKKRSKKKKKFENKTLELHKNNYFWKLHWTANKIYVWKTEQIFDDQNKIFKKVIFLSIIFLSLLLFSVFWAAAKTAWKILFEHSFFALNIGRNGVRSAFKEMVRKKSIFSFFFTTSYFFILTPQLTENINTAADWEKIVVIEKYECGVRRHL